MTQPAHPTTALQRAARYIHSQSGNSQNYQLPVMRAQRVPGRGALSTLGVGLTSTPVHQHNACGMATQLPAHHMLWGSL